VIPGWVILFAIGALLIAAALTQKRWLPRILGFATDNSETIGAIESLFQIAFWFVASMSIIWGIVKVGIPLSESRAENPAIESEFTSTFTHAPPTEPLSTPTPTLPRPTITSSPEPTATALASSTPTPTPYQTPTPNFTPAGFCDEFDEPCLYLPKAGESWQTVADASAYEDVCRWPEIANLNRRPDGTYRGVKGILRIAGIFVPIPNPPGYYIAHIIDFDGLHFPIELCPEGGGGEGLPCRYKIEDGQGFLGLNYLPLALKFYGGYEKNGTKLDEYIQDANLSDGCDGPPPRLFPGVELVIPALP